jgi:hypothetical protein
MKMEQTECSETPAYKIQTPGNYPEESIQHFIFLLDISVVMFDCLKFAEQSSADSVTSSLDSGTPVPSQTNPRHTSPPPCSFKIHFNSALPFTARSSNRSLSFRFPHQKLICIYRLWCVLHAPPVSSTLYSVCSRKHAAPCYSAQ